MKQLKVVLLSMVLGVAIGLWFGVNIGREVPWYSNPFASRETLDQKIKRATGETLEKGGHALEQAGQALQDKLKK
jgi:hypothetical protein